VSSGEVLDVALSGVAIPTVIIVGREDQLTPVALSQEIHALAPESTFHVSPDCGHLPPIEKPKIMAALLNELLARRQVSGHVHSPSDLQD
jgi:pimeloyl-ACP methyl ester carboxylesterase